jgi:signal transduction histidine kinase
VDTPIFYRHDKHSRIGMTNVAINETDSADTWLVDLPPTARQSWSALAIAAVVLIGFGAVVPFAGRPLAELNALFPSLDAIVFVTDLITAVLLFAQFSISRSRPLLVLASGYLFTALIVIPHALTFAGAFSPTGLLGAGIQTGSWLFIFWHIGFATALLAYAVLRKGKRTKPTSETSTLTAIGWCVTSVFGLVCGLTWLATAGAALLPPIVLDKTHISQLVVYPVLFTILISAIAIGLLLVGRRSVLDQWLVVVALVSILDMAFSGLLPTVRFSVGFYAGRVLSLITSSIVLIVLVAETTRLYVRLARSNAMLQRERNNKLMNLEAMPASIAHEVKQPLTGITTFGSATLRFLGQTPPNLARAVSAVNKMIFAGQNAGQILDNIRALFGRAELAKDQIDVNELGLDVLRGLDSDLKSHRIALSIILAPELPPIIAHKIQLQEVITNLVRNAIEAMDLVADGHRMLKFATELSANSTITITVEDTGPGFDPDKSDAMFDVFVTTKSHGMGMGLAICRMIIERHGGQLSASSAIPRGAIFRITLPRTN